MDGYENRGNGGWTVGYIAAEQEGWDGLLVLSGTGKTNIALIGVGWLIDCFTRMVVIIHANDQ